MKKRIISIVFVVAIAVTAAWNFSQSKTEVDLPDLALTNIEALAWGEEGSVKCCPDSADTCMVGSTSVRDYDEC
ncbi:MAG: NVEALA domain-containing protein [Tannerellaceae bacterium]|jgi:lipopolysaccharide export system protein LptC|nr:NVEALA domain-containing protein [Tannerellaceae bacterium]